MRPGEYETLYRVEERHWWHRALRAMIAQHWRGRFTGARPRVLDVGCGTGGTLQLFAAHAWAAGIDASPLAIGWCRRRGLARTAVARAQRLPFAEGSFDAVVSCDVLCHAGVDDSALAEMARVLRPGGALLLNLPAYPWLLSEHDAAVSNDRRFTRGEVLRMLRACGLQVERATYWNSVFFPAIAMMRLWRKFKLKTGAGHKETVSDLEDEPPAWVAGTVSAILALERAVIRVAPLPFGLSIFVVARKGGAEMTTDRHR